MVFLIVVYEVQIFGVCFCCLHLEFGGVSKEIDRNHQLFTCFVFRAHGFSLNGLY